MTNIRHTFFASLALVFAGMNLVTLANPLIGLICFGLFLHSLAMLFGSRFATLYIRTKDYTLGLLTGLSILILAGSVLYYLATVTMVNLFICLIIVTILASLSSTKTKKEPKPLLKNQPPIVWIGVICFFLFLGAWWFVIGNQEIESAVRSVWMIIDPRILFAFLASALLIGGLANRLSKKATTIVFSLLIFSGISVAAFVFIHGYGFDPFIHRATVEHIIEYGTITPKPFYYIGQYALELIGTIIFALPLKTLDVFLVPTLTSVLLPLAIFGLTKNKTPFSIMSLFGLFLLPLGAFINTTPQSLAYILLICLVLISLQDEFRKQKTHFIIFLFILTAAIFITHPLAGIPAFIYTFLALTQQIPCSKSIKTALMTIGTLFGALALPVVFLIQSLQNNLAINFSLANLSWDHFQFSGFFHNQYNAWLDLFYVFIENRLWIILLLSISGILFAFRKNYAKPLLPSLYAALAAIISYIILRLTFQFDFLIDYEQANYTNRLITIVTIFLFPAVLLGISSILLKIKKQHIYLHLSCVTLIAVMAMAYTYGTYPRHDNYARSAGFNVSQVDFNAVQTIEDYAQGANYIVLANQATSAAALERFGFAHYYKNDIFYYPIPTGEPLYTYFLQMTNESPTQETMHQAMELADVDLGFFAVSDYWWESEKIIEQAKNQSSDWFSLGDGSITVFVFE